MRGASVKHEQIPATLKDLSLNLRAYIDLPPRQVTLEEEVRAIVDKARTRMVGPEEATRAILGIIGREQEQFEQAVRDAL